MVEWQPGAWGACLPQQHPLLGGQQQLWRPSGISCGLAPQTLQRHSAGRRRAPRPSEDGRAAVPWADLRCLQSRAGL